MAENRIEPDEERWFVFAAVMLLLAGAANMLWAVAAWANREYFATNELLYGDLSMWATILVAIALVECLTAFVLFTGNPAGAYLGILAAGLNILGQLMVVGAYPIWSVIIITVDAIVIYGLAIHCLPKKTA